MTELNIAQTNSLIRSMAVEILLKEMQQAPHENQHDFCDGIYARTFSCPAGVLLTGAIHKHESFFVLRSGQMIVSTDDGDIIALPGFMCITKSGTKRIVYALTDIQLTTFHANPENLRAPSDLWNAYTVDAPKNLIEKAKELMQ